MRVASWPDFEPDALLRRLTAAGVDFVVIGGYAAIAHGASVLTSDLDICFAPDDANLDALGRVLIDLDARLRGIDEDVPFVPDAATLRRIMVLILDTADGPLDVLVEPSGAPRYEVLRRRAERLDLGGFAVLVASLDDLIAMKAAAGRPKDLMVLAELEAIRRLRR